MGACNICGRRFIKSSLPNREWTHPSNRKAPARSRRTASPRRIERSVRYSRTTLTCSLRATVYGAYSTETTFRRARRNRWPLNNFRLSCSHCIVHRSPAEGPAFPGSHRVPPHFHFHPTLNEPLICSRGNDHKAKRMGMNQHPATSGSSHLSEGVLYGIITIP